MEKQYFTKGEKIYPAPNEVKNNHEALIKINNDIKTFAPKVNRR